MLGFFLYRAFRNTGNYLHKIPSAVKDPLSSNECLFDNFAQRHGLSDPAPLESAPGFLFAGDPFALDGRWPGQDAQTCMPSVDSALVGEDAFFSDHSIKNVSQVIPDASAFTAARYMGTYISHPIQRAKAISYHSENLGALVNHNALKSKDLSAVWKGLTAGIEGGKNVSMTVGLKIYPAVGISKILLDEPLKELLGDDPVVTKLAASIITAVIGSVYEARSTIVNETLQNSGGKPVNIRDAHKAIPTAALRNFGSVFPVSAFICTVNYFDEIGESLSDVEKASLSLAYGMIGGLLTLPLDKRSVCMAAQKGAVSLNATQILTRAMEIGSKTLIGVLGVMSARTVISLYGEMKEQFIKDLENGRMQDTAQEAIGSYIPLYDTIKTLLYGEASGLALSQNALPESEECSVSHKDNKEKEHRLSVYNPSQKLVAPLTVPPFPMQQLPEFKTHNLRASHLEESEPKLPIKSQSLHTQHSFTEMAEGCKTPRSISASLSWEDMYRSSNQTNSLGCFP